MADLLALKRARRAVTAYFFFLGFGGANWLAHMPKIRHDLGLGDMQLGFFLLSGGIGALTAFRCARVFLRRYHNNQVVVAGTCGAAALLFVPATVSNVWAAAAGLFAMGFCNGLVDVTINASAVEVERRLKKPILSSMHGFCSLGSFAGAACGTLATGIHLAPPIHLALVGAGVVGLSLLYANAMLDEGPGATPQAPPKTVYTAPLLLLGCVAFCSSVGEGAMAQWTAVYLHDELHTSFFEASVGYAAYSAAMVSGRLLGDRLTGHWPAHTVFNRCGLLVAICLTVGLSTSFAPLMVAGAVGAGFGLSLIIPTVFRCAVKLPNMSAASALASVATLSYGGFLFGPPSIGFVAEAVSLRAALGLVAGMAALMGVIGAKVSGRMDRPSQRTRPLAEQEPAVQLPS